MSLIALLEMVSYLKKIQSTDVDLQSYKHNWVKTNSHIQNKLREGPGPECLQVTVVRYVR